MVQQITFTTDVSIPAGYTIDGVPYTHPTTTDLLLPTGYLTAEEVAHSDQFQEALDLGYITLVDDLGTNITNVADQVNVSNAGNLTVANSAVTDDLEIGYLNNLTPGGPNTFGIRRRTGANGYFAWFPNANFPQMMAGNPNATSNIGFFIDVDSGGDLYLNVLNTGVVGLGRVLIGKGVEGNVILNGYPDGILVTVAGGGIETRTPIQIRDRATQQSQTQQLLTFAGGGGTPTPYQTINDSSMTTGKDADYLFTANFSARTIGSNNRTVQFAIFVDGVETITFESTRFDQQNDDKSITIRWQLPGLTVGQVVDWRVRNVAAATDLRFNRRNFSMEEY